MRGYIYARVSTQNQDYMRQLSELKLYAEQHDIEIVETFQEKVSGRKNIRPELERMKKSIVGNKNKPDGEKIDIILLWEISRLSRRMIDLQKNVFFFLDEGIRIYCKKDNWM
jgi:DNA invertase Pin-like site-specific DNA recombinase